MSFKPEVSVNETGEDKFYPNGLAFATYDEALASAKNTYSRWMLATGYRAVESDQEVNYRWDAVEGLVAL